MKYFAWRVSLCYISLRIEWSMFHNSVTFIHFIVSLKGSTKYMYKNKKFNKMLQDGKLLEVGKGIKKVCLVTKEC